MSESEFEKIKDVVLEFAPLLESSFSSEQKELFLQHLSTLKKDDAIDELLLTLYRFLDDNKLTLKDIEEHDRVLLNLNPDKYKTKQDLFERLDFLKKMNLDTASTSLLENHYLITSAFDKFNKLLQLRFDAYYTGGALGKFMTNHPLERYHSDLDLLINEEQIVELYHLVETSSDFSFLNNLDNKSLHGHEFKIIYRNTPINIGLFLFHRAEDGSMIFREYFRENGETFLEEQHTSKKWCDKMFPTTIREKNGAFYRSLSLEGLYFTKINSKRPKDSYDVEFLKPYIDNRVYEEIVQNAQDNYYTPRQKVSSSVADLIKEQENHSEAKK